MINDNFNSKQFKEIFELVEQYKRKIEPYERILEKMKFRSPYIENAYQDMARSFELMPNRFDSMLLLNNLPSDLFEHVEEVREKLDRLEDSLSIANEFFRQTKYIEANFFEKQYEIAQIFSSLSHYFKDYSLSPFDRINDSAAKFIAIQKMYDVPERIIQEAFQPSMAYQNFVLKQFSHLEKEPVDVINRRTEFVELTGSLLCLADSAIELGLLAQFEANESSLKAAPDEENEEFYLKKTPNVYKILNQHVGYAFKPKLSTNIREVFSNAKPTKISSYGATIVHLVYQINDMELRKNNSAIFKPTNKLLYACSSIPTHIVQSEKEFAEIIDHLYFLLYEGTGAAKRLTNLAETKEDLDILWSLKHFRLSFRHDIEHGSERDVAKKYQNISNAYQKLLGIPKARHPKDWILAQLKLYELLIEMLEKIYEAQNLESGSE